ncbi:MAG: hypothetical protein KH142_04675 [Slackia piriformis]|uniref:Trigger factor C-terminal domain-containing protein n=1 Tax=Slackia piriformis TaxID=626934 RepID=A0A943UXK2_9ACTN|nr:hypothetical protein [Slackia piriformis]
MEISVFDENAVPFSADVALDAEEVDMLVADAYARLARVLKRPESDVRSYAHQLMTAREIQTFLEETIMARSGERALSKLGIFFMGAPGTDARSEFSEHAPFLFRVTSRPLPAMQLDMETPIARRRRKKPRHADRQQADARRTAEEAVEEPAAPAPNGSAAQGPKIAPPYKSAEQQSGSDEEFVAETLRARLNGTIPEMLLRDAVARKKEEFLFELGEKGITYREYRIAHGVKPQDVQDALYDEAFDELSRDIALDTVFAKQNLAVSHDDESAILTDMAPGREESLLAELDATGKRWMLEQKARRSVALRWAVEHLLAE